MTIRTAVKHLAVDTADLAFSAACHVRWALRAARMDGYRLGRWRRARRLAATMCLRCGRFYAAPDDVLCPDCVWKVDLFPQRPPKWARSVG